MFRPCIDLHEGRVKQIVGGSISDGSPDVLRTNFTSDRSAGWYADLYRQDGLKGGHVIMLGPGNEAAAIEAVQRYPGGLQLGGGVHAGNAQHYLNEGASHVIVTSWIFQDGNLDLPRLKSLQKAIGKEHLVIDLSCRKRDGKYWVVTNRWQTFTQLQVNQEVLNSLSGHCDEFLIHAVDVEGLCQGVDLELVEILADNSPIPTTYAGGARNLDDLLQVTEKGRGRIDLTIGSALDIFGGNGVCYKDLVAFNKTQKSNSNS